MAQFVAWYNPVEVIVMVYERIRNLREDSDLTQQQIADKLFINRRTYSSYENGIRGIPPEVLSDIADIFNTSVDYLMGRTNVKKPYPKGWKGRTLRPPFYAIIFGMFFQLPLDFCLLKWYNIFCNTVFIGIYR